jgi:hypothetical protein
VEWSNEVWNPAPGFRPYRWIVQQLQLPENAGVTFPQFVAGQDRRIFDIWSSVFSDQANSLIRVAAGFEENPAYTARVLQNLGGDFDAVSVAAYFGPDQGTLATYTPDTTVDQVLGDALASIPATARFLQSHRALADQYSASLGRHIGFVAYEGGPALEGRYQPYQRALNQASVDPRMYDIFRSFLDSINQIGLEMMVNYEYTDRDLIDSPYGIYGSLNYQDQPLADAPKYRALVDSIMVPPAPAGPGKTNGLSDLLANLSSSSEVTGTVPLIWLIQPRPPNSTSPSARPSPFRSRPTSVRRSPSLELTAWMQPTMVETQDESLGGNQGKAGRDSA